MEILPVKVEKGLANLLDDVLLCKDPYGVALVIGAWNYPLQLTLLPVTGAIAAGNCVVIKPSEVSPATAKIIAELIPKYLDQVINRSVITAAAYDALTRARNKIYDVSCLMRIIVLRNTCMWIVFLWSF